MPAIYAHHQFGEQVYAALNESLQELIAPHKTAFQIGLIEAVKNGNYTVLDRDTAQTPEERQQIMKQHLLVMCF